MNGLAAAICDELVMVTIELGFVSAAFDVERAMDGLPSSETVLMLGAGAVSRRALLLRVNEVVQRPLVKPRECSNAIPSCRVERICSLHLELLLIHLGTGYFLLEKPESQSKPAGWISSDGDEENNNNKSLKRQDDRQYLGYGINLSKQQI